MYPTTIFRFSVILLFFIVCITGFTGCAKSIVTENSSVLQAGMLVENLGNGACRQLQSGLMWQVEESERFSSWQEANDYVKSLKIAGFDNWRLPTRQEYLRLSELLAINKGDCPIKTKKAHWTQVDGKEQKPGYWEDIAMCGGLDFRWVNSKLGSTVLAVRP